MLIAAGWGWGRREEEGGGGGRESVCGGGGSDVCLNSVVFVQDTARVHLIMGPVD